MAGQEITQDRLARLIERFTPDRAAATLAEIVETIADGGTLDDVAESWNAPYGRIFAWIVADPIREGQYDAALRAYANKVALETVGIADSGGGDVQHARLRVDTRLKLATKLDRQRFGEKIDVTVEVVDVIGALTEARGRVGAREPRLIEHNPDDDI